MSHSVKTHKALSSSAILGSLLSSVHLVDFGAKLEVQRDVFDVFDVGHVVSFWADEEGEELGWG